jgi:hypothetical protein
MRHEQFITFTTFAALMASALMLFVQQQIHVWDRTEVTGGLPFPAAGLLLSCASGDGMISCNAQCAM